MRITPKQYAQTLYELTDGMQKSELEKVVSEFASHLKRAGKLKIVEKIIENFEKIYNQERGIVEAHVKSREKLDAQTIEKVKVFLKGKYEAKKVVIRNDTDSNLKGGLVIRVGDDVWDGSVRGKLDRLKNILAH